jgi:hypothetical protein
VYVFLLPLFWVHSTDRWFQPVDPSLSKRKSRIPTTRTTWSSLSHKRTLLLLLGSSQWK